MGGLGAAVFSSEGSRGFLSMPVVCKVWRCGLPGTGTGPEFLLPPWKYPRDSSSRERGRADCHRPSGGSAGGRASVVEVVVQLGVHRLAALVGEHPLLLGEEGHLFGDFADDVLVNLVATGLHLHPDAHLQVLVLQGQEGDKVINEVSVNQTAVPEATWERKRCCSPPATCQPPTHACPLGGRSNTHKLCLLGQQGRGDSAKGHLDLDCKPREAERWEEGKSPSQGQRAWDPGTRRGGAGGSASWRPWPLLELGHLG